jgi:hypothetical protein
MADVSSSRDADVEHFAHAPKLAPIFVKAALAGKKSGKTVPTTRLRLAGHEVDRTHLRDYQRLCGFAVGDELPHTYPHILGFGLQAELMARPAFPLPLAGLVHVENVITVHRALTAEDVLDITVSAANLRPHPKGKQVDLITEVDVEGERVWDGRSTYLARGKGDPEAGRGDQPPALPSGTGVARWRLEGDLGRRYGAISGDVNPIHMSALTAKAMGFPQAIAHGMWTYARTLAALGRHVNEPCTSHVWFKKPVLLPGSVELVVDKSVTPVVAGLRSPRKPETEHLVLTVG